MAITVKHSKTSTIPDGSDTDLIRPSDWNADHTLTGLGTMAEQNASSVAITGGSVNGTSLGATTAASAKVTTLDIGSGLTLATDAGTSGQVLTSAGPGAVPTWTSNGAGDVVGPASSTDNAVARFDSTTGKLLQNSVVTVGDTGVVAGVTELTASTKVVSPYFDANSSAGGALRNASGTNQIQWGGGGGNNVSIDVSTNLNGSNAQIDISPTGTGHVHIKPTGSGSLEIAPTSAGTMNNMVIGGTTPLAITGTTITANTQFSGAGTGLTGTASSLSIGGNAGTVTNGVYTTGSYADPTWITSLAGSKISGTLDGGTF